MNPVEEFRLGDVLALLLFVGVVGVVEALDDRFVLEVAAAAAPPPPLYGIKRDEYDGDGAWANEDVTVEGEIDDDDDVVYEGDEFERQIILHDGDDGGSELLVLFRGGLFLKSNVEFLLWSKCFSFVLFRAIDSNAGK